MMVARGRSEAGVSILEIMIALVVLAIAVLMLMSLMLSSNRLQQDGRERSVAFNAARQMIEDMRSYPMTEIYARFNANTADNLSGVNPGATFTVPGLAPPSSGKHGEILFPEDAAGLRETLSDASLQASLGLPKDLNRNGSTTDTGLAGSAVNLLPVLVRIRWTGQGGKQNSLEMATMISARGNE